MSSFELLIFLLINGRYDNYLHSAKKLAWGKLGDGLEE